MNKFFNQTLELHSFFHKNILYKNTKAEISEILRICYKNVPAANFLFFFFFQNSLCLFEIFRIQ